MTTFEKLKKEVEMVKKGSVEPRYQLYRLYGKAQMARELDAITLDEFMKLNHEIVAQGINNPKYFRGDDNDGLFS
jgi:hypothetical protein